MTQIFTTEGRVVPVTVVEAGPCPVVQKKTVATDGYNAIQIGFSFLRESLSNKPRKGHFQKASLKPMRYVREFRISDVESYEIGQEVKVDLFTVGDRIDVVGTSKGKGLSLIHISEPTRLGMISYAVFCLKKKNKNKQKTENP